MKTKIRAVLYSLPAQMILSFAGVVLLTAAAVGLPAIFLIRGQLQSQAWAQVEQGRQAAEALYATHESEMLNLAALVAQRPTLQQLLAEGDNEATLFAYLQTLKSGTDIDVMLVCDAHNRVVARVGKEIPEALCEKDPIDGFQTLSDTEHPQVWLLASQPVGSNVDEGRQGLVIVGTLLDDNFDRRMKAQTGLEHTIWVNNVPVSTSLGGDVTRQEDKRQTAPGDPKWHKFTLDSKPYQSIRFLLSRKTADEPVDAPVLEAEVALDVSGAVATRQRLVWILASSIVVVVALGSGLGTLLARRIGEPLSRLANSATALSQGNYDSPVPVESRVREIALVSQSLEQARIELQHTLSELRQEKAWADHLLEAIVEGIVTLNERGRITFFSSGAERITGWTRDEVLNLSCNDVFRPVGTDEAFSQFIPPPGRRQKVVVELANGHQATLAVTGARLMPPKAGDARVALVFRDVSEEETIHRLMGHFLANVAHEFRTPLSALAASAELLLDQAPNLSTGELQELLTSLHISILGLQNLVDNLLESASIEAGHFHVRARSAVNPSQIIAEAIRMMHPLLEIRGQRLLLDLPPEMPVVKADSRRMVQVLVNLLSNASKYGPDNAEITIGACVDEDWVTVSVADRGPGVSPEHKNDLFHRFVYVESKGDKPQYGAGLGLSVVRAVVEAHGGNVGVDDRPGGGLVFWFALPMKQNES